MLIRVPAWLGAGACCWYRSRMKTDDERHRNVVAPDPTEPSWLRRSARYPDWYAWYVLLAALDVMLTWMVLHFGGREVNVLADWVIRRWQLPGMVVYKFATVVLVVVICEVVGRRRERLGRRLAEWAVAITAVPVVLALAQLFLAVHG